MAVNGMFDGSRKKDIFFFFFFVCGSPYRVFEGQGAGKMLSYIKSLSTPFPSSSIGLRFYIYSYIMDAKYPKFFGDSDRLEPSSTLTACALHW